ncbi:hypothetical protein MAMC_01566 [Methylacidimicrobium cyclopophantes]|uniref:Uncharacterized protein n=1 Tax=Methylacidimicrobium cyclopophantes TaxID=1041766 RepID=A0A5E6MMT1_9BACT|nr:hypothetical protein [Methylacidimicrobium cyclopophantes]VVM07351.1 hypothetical protein MAMC_01566 [Methylacidimicrobium cyclopophantes]
MQTRFSSKGFVWIAGWIGISFVSSAWAGGEFEPTFPKFPYGPTDPHGNPYCVAATDLVYSPKSPYVRASSDLSRPSKPKRSSRRVARKTRGPVDSKGTP